MLIFSWIQLRIKGKDEHWGAREKTKSFVMEDNL